MSELPDCPLCGEKADPRWYIDGVMFCDGCCPPNEWSRPRARHAIAREKRLATARERIAELETLTAIGDTAYKDGASEWKKCADGWKAALESAAGQLADALVRIAALEASDAVVNASHVRAVERSLALEDALFRVCLDYEAERALISSGVPQSVIDARALLTTNRDDAADE